MNEVFVIGESPLGEAVLGDDDAPDRMEVILKLVARGTFPRSGQREQLTDGQHRQLRDAMILEAHTREDRDIFISDDRKAFVGENNLTREALQREFGVTIMTSEEFIAYCDERRLQAL